MMRYARMALYFLLAFVAVTFAVKNSDYVTIDYYFLSKEWQTPVYALVYGSFCVGFVAGVAWHILKKRRAKPTPLPGREAGPDAA